MGDALAYGGGRVNLAYDNGLPGLDRVIVWFNDPGNWWGSGGLFAHIGEHLAYTLIVVVLAVALALPLGLLIGHTRRGTALVAGVANILRAVPTLGLLILLIVLLSPHIPIQAGAFGIIAPGAGPYFVPALLVLLVLAVPPILTSTYAGIQALDPAIRDAAEGIGMTPLQVAVKVELPCALPLLLSGIRSATLQVIATLTVAAYAPLVGGLGRLIVDGQQNLADPRYGYPAMIAAGLTIAVLAVAIDALLGLAQRLITSPGLTTAGAHRPSPMTSQSLAQNSSHQALSGRPSVKDLP
ncbi:ABC transporter permease [Streptomyces sp. NPDC002917]|uniref:ABC transporter permease n=1 Tax=unclassified Streptomyces TaxID=2593676 RepID=UPI003690FCA8